MKYSIKWGFPAVIAMTLGLSGCLTDGMFGQDRASNPVDYSSVSSAPTASKNDGSAPVEGKSSAKSYSSKDPVQKTTPGPKRSAAPQMPVIQ